MASLADIIKVARGEEPCDLVIRGGKVINVLSGEIYKADVAVFDGIVVGLGEYEGREEMDVSGKYLAPGFIDGHVHIEMLDGRGKGVREGRGPERHHLRGCRPS